MTITRTRFHVAVVGGGITGLSTAWYLQQGAQAAGLELQVTVLEAGDRWGGKIQTDTLDGYGNESFVVEGGPDSFITQKPWALQLARELGLEAELLGTNDAQRQVYVLNRGKPTPLPDGVLLIIPTKFMPFALSPLISPLGKLRMGLDLLIPAKRDGEDETLAEFVTRRLGAEALDKIAEPLMTGIYNAEADKQSLLATFPRFRQLEEKYGSLTRGMLASRRNRKAAPSSNGKKPPSVFVSLRAGTEALVTTLVDQLTATMRLKTRVTGVAQTDAGYTLALDGGDSLAADAVILTAPAYVAADIVRDLVPDAAAELDAIRYVSTGTVSFAYRAEDVPNLLPGFGLVIPTSAGRPINAVTISSTKFNHRAPEGHILLRAFFGGSRSPESMHLDDTTLVQTIREELRTLLQIDAEPLFERIYRWHNANPQYDVGHLERVTTIEDSLPQGLMVTGSPYRGIGLPDCVHQAQGTAQTVLEQLAARVQDPAED